MILAKSEKREFAALRGSQAAQLCGDAAREQVFVEAEVSEVGEAAELCGDAARQQIVVKNQPIQVGEAAEFYGDAARESVSAEAEIGEGGEAAELRGDAAREQVVVEQEPGEAGEAAELRGDAAGQQVVAERELSEGCKIAYLRRQSAADAWARIEILRIIRNNRERTQGVALVVVQIQRCDSTGGDSDAGPGVYFLSGACAPGSERVICLQVVVGCYSCPVVLDGY